MQKVVWRVPGTCHILKRSDHGLLRGDRGNGTEIKKSYGFNFLYFFFFEINVGMITFADDFVYEQFGDMINILHEMCA